MKYLIQHYLNDSLNNRRESVAVKQGDRLFSYGEIDDISRRYQSFFQNGSMEKVGILSRVRAEAICAMIGALRAGVVYVPLNTLAPKAWLGNICTSAGIETLLVDSAFYQTAQELREFGIKNIVLIDQDNPDSQITDIETRLEDILAGKLSTVDKPGILCDDIAYVLYTSGSTGNPKGILISHRNSYTFIDWMVEEFCLNAEDRVFSRAPLQFDLSVFDIFSTFMVGATLVIAPMGFSNKAEEIVSLMRDEKVTMVYTVPSAFNNWMSKGKLERGIPSLRQVMYAGEPFTIPFLRRFMTCIPGTRVSNIYGPTETNIVTYYHLNSIEQLDEVATQYDSVPIGKPVHDTEIYIVDEKLRLVEDGEIGEILVRGGTVFSGYFNDPDRTRERLVQSPLHGYPTLLCKTGDLGRYLPDGNILYHGRRDNMVKTRGYRVEIGEVESAMSSISGIHELAVVARPHEKYGNSLHAFVSLKRNEVTVEEINNQLSTKIPSYMMPFDITPLESLPRTSTGKIDRVGLCQLTNKDVSS